MGGDFPVIGNHTKHWKTRGNLDKCYLLLSVIYKWTVYVSKKKHIKDTSKWKNTWKIRIFVSPEKWGQCKFSGYSRSGVRTERGRAALAPPLEPPMIIHSDHTLPIPAPPHSPSLPPLPDLPVIIYSRFGLGHLPGVTDTLSTAIIPFPVPDTPWMNTWPVLDPGIVTSRLFQ